MQICTRMPLEEAQVDCYTHLQSHKLIRLLVFGLVHHAISPLPTMPVFLNLLVAIHRTRLGFDHWLLRLNGLQLRCCEPAKRVLWRGKVD